MSDNEMNEWINDEIMQTMTNPSILMDFALLCFPFASFFIPQF
jgi:hypothetical protein